MPRDCPCFKLAVIPNPLTYLIPKVPSLLLERPPTTPIYLTLLSPTTPSSNPPLPQGITLPKPETKPLEPLVQRRAERWGFLELFQRTQGRDLCKGNPWLSKVRDQTQPKGVDPEANLRVQV